ncbi:MAG TPA: hypothetical protein VGV12_10530 [Gemmatimonadales bacterium]|nr:hypothetical protein [Gemmatimonadales bacterium]
MRRHVTLGLTALRATGLSALALLAWNPTAARHESSGGAPLVLLDASLSMAEPKGRWREALDTARRIAQGGGTIWRFGERVTGFDTLPPGDGASRLAPAVAAAAARGGPMVVVTDGAISDAADIPPDLLRRARIVSLPRAPFFDAFVSDIAAPRRIGTDDSLRLSVTYGTAGKEAGDKARKKPGKGEAGKATLALSLAGKRLLSRPVVLPDSGMVTTEFTLPPSPASHGPLTGPSRASLPAGWQVLEVRLEGVAGDAEPRDDARRFVIEVSPQPSVVLLASPPDWETRFLARTLADVARLPVRTFVETERPGKGWRDAVTLESRPAGEVARAVASAQLLIEAGDPAAFTGFVPKGAMLLWPGPGGSRQDGDWYVQPPGPSPLAAALAGVAWDSLPPAASLAELPPDSSAVVVLAARLARRGPPRPVLVLSERDGRRRAVIAAGGLYRWAFRGGASGEAYRALVAGVSDWLLEQGAGSRERFLPVTYETPNGTPLVWRWETPGTARDIVLSLATDKGQRVDTLRFDAGGRAELHLPPGAYRYSVRDGPEHGLVVVDDYSDEWRPAARVLTSQPGAADGRSVPVALRDRWWLFVLATLAFATEWAWRRRQGLP